MDSSDNRARRWRLAMPRPLVLVFVAWILPVGLMIYNVVYYQAQIGERALMDFANSVDYSAGLTAERLGRSISNLRKASYDKTLEVAYLRYESGSMDEGQLYAAANEFVRDNYYEMSDVRFAAIVVMGRVSDELQSRSAYGEYRAFVEADLKEIEKLAVKSGDDIGFYSNGGGELYIFHNLTANTATGGATVYGLAVFKLDTAHLFATLLGGRFPEKTMIVRAGDGGGVRIEPFGAAVEAYADGFDVPAKPERRDGESVCGGEFITPDYELSYLATVPNGVLYEGYSFYMRVMGLTLFLFFALLLYYNLISKPVTRLTRAISRMELSKLGVRVDQNEKSEFRFLFSAFEGMNHQLIALQEQTYREELAARDAKIESLRSQINPHFVNNTLELMAWQARMGDAQGVAKTIDAMAVMMGAAINREQKKIAPLGEEIDYARAYMHIVAERYGKRLAIVEDMPDALPAVNVPPLIIQPLLENAVKYGIEPVGGGRVTLRIREEGGLLRIDVLNTGQPLSAAAQLKIARILMEDGYTESVGLRNIALRLELIYGEAARLEVFADGHETTARIVLPTAAGDGD